jgi:hypothetical protein
MLPINWNTAIRYANLVKIAESVVPSGSYRQSQIEQIKAGGYTFLETIYGDELATDIDPHIGEVVSFGFLAVSDAKELVAAIRGTDTILEWLHDASFLMVPCPGRSQWPHRRRLHGGVSVVENWDRERHIVGEGLDQGLSRYESCDERNRLRPQPWRCTGDLADSARTHRLDARSVHSLCRSQAHDTGNDRPHRNPISFAGGTDPDPK